MVRQDGKVKSRNLISVLFFCGGRIQLNVKGGLYWLPVHSCARTSPIGSNTTQKKHCSGKKHGNRVEEIHRITESLIYVPEGSLC